LDVTDATEATAGKASANGYRGDHDRQQDLERLQHAVARYEAEMGWENEEVSLPSGLLSAIGNGTDDDAEQERLAIEWCRVARDTTAAAERIRGKVRDRRCRCLTAADITDGRCGRCLGTIEPSEPA
jgi:hypothetical protein